MSFIPSRHFLVDLVLAVVIAFVMLWLVPKILPISDVTSHLTAKLQAPVIGGFYPINHRDEITVLLIDDATLLDVRQGWPVTYGTHARWLDNIGSVYKPRAIFIDITFFQARKDDSLTRLITSLCEFRERGVPVYIAALEDPLTGQLRVRPELMPNADGKGCFKLVSVNYEPHKVDHLVWLYPLHGNEAGSRSAALALAEDVAALNVPHHTEPMALTWGVNNLGLPQFGEWCRKAGGGIAEMVPPGLKALWMGDEVLKPICPYSRVLAMSDLKAQSDADEQRLHQMLDGRYLMIGASINGANDLINSPVHGTIPGVFMHAMALDNLLTYNGQYKRALEWDVPPPIPLFVLGVLTVVIAQTLHVGLKSLRNFSEHRWKAAIRRILRGRPALRKHNIMPFLAFCLMIASKGLSIFASALVITLVIVVSQRLFNVGILPIVDLAAMALVAEWLGWTPRILRFIKKYSPLRVFRREQ